MDIIGGQHLRQMWDDLADVYGHKTALICESSGGVVNRYSYLELNQEINRKPVLYAGDSQRRQGCSTSRQLPGIYLLLVRAGKNWRDYGAN